MTGRDKMTCKMTCTQLAEAIAVPAATIGFCYEEERRQTEALSVPVKSVSMKPLK